MTDLENERTGPYLYVLSMRCPICEVVTQFVEATTEPIAIDQDVSLKGKDHCPECGVHLRKAGAVWDREAEHEVTAVSPNHD